MRVRVVCGLFETIEIFCPQMAFNNVDLPTLGRPTKVTNPLRTSDRVVANDTSALHEMQHLPDEQ